MVGSNEAATIFFWITRSFPTQSPGLLLLEDLLSLLHIPGRLLLVVLIDLASNGVQVALATLGTCNPRNRLKHSKPGFAL